MEYIGFNMRLLLSLVLLYLQPGHFFIMKKKIKIKINGKINKIDDKTKLSDLVKKLKVPLKKVAIELNQEIVDKKKIKNINLKNNDKIEIVHFIGGG